MINKQEIGNLAVVRLGQPFLAFRQAAKPMTSSQKTKGSLLTLAWREMVIK